jgi:hypothetical protein
MSATQKEIFIALWSQVKDLDRTLGAKLKFVFKSRRVQMWDTLSEAQQPAIFLQILPQHTSEAVLGLPIWRLPSAIWIYFKAESTDDPNYAPSDSILDYIEGVKASLVSIPPGEKQTLGNRVTHCWIDGTVLFNEGQPGIDNQVVIMVPITILVGN